MFSFMIIETAVASECELGFEFPIMDFLTNLLAIRNHAVLNIDKK